MERTLAKAKEIMEQNNGNLDLSHSKVTSLTDGLKFKGNLYVFNTKITSLPDESSLDLSEGLIGLYLRLS